jgi:hypothetical protein
MGSGQRRKGFGAAPIRSPWLLIPKGPMKLQGVPTSSSAEDICESVFLGSAVLGAVAGVIGATVCSARLLGGGYAEALAVAGAALGCWLLGTLGAVVFGPACAAVLHHRRAPAPAAVEGQPAASFGDAAMT